MYSVTMFSAIQPMPSVTKPDSGWGYVAAAVHVTYTPHAFAISKAFKVHSELLDCFLRPET